MLKEVAEGVARIIAWGVIGCIVGLIISAFGPPPHLPVTIGGLMGGVVGFLLSG